MNSVPLQVFKMMSLANNHTEYRYLANINVEMFMYMEYFEIKNFNIRQKSNADSVKE